MRWDRGDEAGGLSGGRLDWEGMGGEGHFPFLRPTLRCILRALCLVQVAFRTCKKRPRILIHIF